MYLDRRLWPFTAGIRHRIAFAALVGLCSACRHARTVTSARGSTFWLCELSVADARFRKYPPLPVVRCPGFETPAPDRV